MQLNRSMAEREAKHSQLGFKQDLNGLLVFGLLVNPHVFQSHSLCYILIHSSVSRGLCPIARVIHAWLLQVLIDWQCCESHSLEDSHIVLALRFQTRYESPILTNQWESARCQTMHVHSCFCLQCVFIVLSLHFHENVCFVIRDKSGQFRFKMELLCVTIFWMEYNIYNI